MMLGESRPFGKLLLGATKVAIASPTGLACAYIGLRPIYPNHCVVAPVRCVPLLSDLSDEEFDSLFECVRDVQALFGRDASAHNIAVADGAAAGQPTLLPHAHVHVVPRRQGDLTNNDEIYDRIGEWSPDGAPTVPPPFYVPSDAERKPRTAEMMADEANRYATLGASSTVSTDRIARIPVGGAPLPAEKFTFGRIALDPSQIFYASQLSVATVNLKPLCPGHVLCIPRRNVPRLAELSDEERRDLWRLVREVMSIVKAAHGADGCKLGVQDGKDAGQSVPHVHVHVLPHRSGA